jgi:hypothetical protein
MPEQLGPPAAKVYVQKPPTSGDPNMSATASKSNYVLGYDEAEYARL